MPRYQYGLIVLALLALVGVTPPFVNGVRRELAKTDAAASWAEIRANVSKSARYLTSAQPVAAAQDTPMRFADFVGTWHHHGYSLTIYPDGRGVAVWRTYDGDTPDAPGGQASITFTRVEGRTLYGTNPHSATRELVALTEYDYGVGFLADGVDAAATNAPYDPRHGITLCGPRFADAPEWFRATAPCGA